MLSSSCVVIFALLAVCSAFSPSAAVRSPGPAHTSRRAIAHPFCVASSDTDKALLAAAKKVLFAAKSFGKMQGEVAQLWVEEALRGGDASTAGLEMIETALFDECKVEDGGKCEQLTSGMDELLALVEEKQGKPPSTGFFALKLGATPFQAAATKVKAAARKFGPEQEEAADAWIKNVVAGQEVGGASLLEEQIMLFGECALSESGTTSNCEELEGALAELQEALEACDITSAKVGRVAPTNLNKASGTGRVAPTNLNKASASSTKVGRVTPTKTNAGVTPMANDV